MCGFAEPTIVSHLARGISEPTVDGPVEMPRTPIIHLRSKRKEVVAVACFDDSHELSANGNAELSIDRTVCWKPAEALCWVTTAKARRAIALSPQQMLLLTAAPAHARLRLQTATRPSSSTRLGRAAFC